MFEIKTRSKTDEISTLPTLLPKRKDSRRTTLDDSEELVQLLSVVPSLTATISNEPTYSLGLWKTNTTSPNFSNIDHKVRIKTGYVVRNFAVEKLKYCSAACYLWASWAPCFFYIWLFIYMNFVASCNGKSYGLAYSHTVPLKQALLRLVFRLRN